jgi:hypothetical protein
MPVASAHTQQRELVSVSVTRIQPGLWPSAVAQRVRRTCFGPWWHARQLLVTQPCM